MCYPPTRPPAAELLSRFRTSPLAGRYFANVFVHFMPVHHEGHGDSSEFASSKKYAEKVRGFEDKSDKGWFGFGKKTPAKPVSGHEAHEGPHLDVEEPEEKPRPKKDAPAEKSAEKEPPRKKPVPTEERETDGPSTDDDDTDDKDDTSPLHVAAGIGELARARPLAATPSHSAAPLTRSNPYGLRGR